MNRIRLAIVALVLMTTVATAQETAETRIKAIFDELRRNVAADIDEAERNALAALPPTTQPVPPPPPPPPPPPTEPPPPSPVQTAASVSQFGITWTFDRAYPVGQFANGDWWVVGPVKVNGVSPAPSGSGGSYRNGTMVNPGLQPNEANGYDGRAPGVYQAALSLSYPATISGTKSLVSTISSDSTMSRIGTQAILTVVAEAPPAGSFRPPYSGTTKPIYNVNQLRKNLLLNLAPPAQRPTQASIAAWFERPWIDHYRNWSAQRLHPINNMPSYGREISQQIGDAALMLLCNESVVGNKDVLLTRFVQLGIDLYGFVEVGGEWWEDGGHASGRQWPIMFAGLMLGVPEMVNVGQRDTSFGETGQTFYVAAAVNGYNASHIGMPEWGIRHGSNPSLDTPNWAANYRQCCTANAWCGWVLAARAMGQRQAFDHPALFDYMDRYMKVTNGEDDGWTVPNESAGWRSWSAFSEAMWDMHRVAF